MKKLKRLPLWVCMTLSFSSFADTSLLKKNLVEIQNGSFKGDNFSKRIILDEVRYNSEESFGILRPETQTNSEKKQSALSDSKKIQDKYFKAKKRYDRDLEIYDITSRTVKFGMGQASDLLSITPAKVVFDGVSEVVSYALDKGAEGVKNSAVKNMENIILEDLAKKEEAGEIRVQDLTGLTARQYDEKYFGDKTNLAKMFQDVDVEHKAAVNAVKIQALKNIARESDIQSRIRDRNQDTSIENNKNVVIKVATTLNNYINKTETSLNLLKNAQTRINENLNTVTREVGKNTSNIADNREHIAFIEEFMYSKMSPEEQLQALEKDLYFIEDNKKEILKAQIEAVKAKRDLIKGISTYLEGASEIIGIANNFGIKDPILAEVTKAVDIGSKGLDVALNIAAGGPMGYLKAASTISGMFGGGSKKSAEAAHRKQVVGMLSELLQGQHKTRIKLDEIHADIGRVLQGIVTISNQIEILDQKLDSYHIEQMSKLGDIHMDLYMGVQLIKADVGKEISACSQFETAIDNYQEFLERKATYKEVRNYVYDEYDVLQYKDQCISGINNIINNTKEIHPIFYQYSIQGADLTPDPSGNKNYADIINYLKKYSEGFLGHKYKELLPSALQTTKKISILAQKLEYLNKNTIYDKDFKKSFINGNYVEQFDTLLSPVSIVDYGQGILNFAPLLNYVQGKSDLASFEDILAGKYSGLRLTKTLKKGLLPIVDIAIAQQNIIRGDIIIPLMAKVLLKSQKGSDQYKETIKLILKNRSLATNFLRYIISLELKRKKSNTISYGIALKSNRIEFLKNTLAYNWDLKLDSGKYYVKLLDNFTIQIPSAQDIEAQELVSTYAHKKLFKFKARIVETLVDIEMAKKLRGSELSQSHGLLVYFGLNK